MSPRRLPPSADDVVVTFSRGWAAAAFVCLAGLATLGIAMGAASDSTPGRIGLAALGLLLAVGALRQLSLIWSPLLMFSTSWRTSRVIVS